jgi:glycine/D-amino acid oxidase-like deaminating enzyme
MASSYDIAVIGGGMVGVSAAYQCAKRGLRTLLVERRHLGSGGSGGNFGLALWSTGQPSSPYALQRERDGAARVARLSEELEFDIEYRPAHGHCIICSEEELRLFRWHCDVFTAAGFSERIITPAELREAEPAIHIGPQVIAALQTDEAVLNPLRLVQAFWRAARRHGADALTYAPVIGFERAGSRITAIITPAGRIPVGYVALTAGSWSRQVALLAGVSLPEYYIQAEAVVTEPAPPLLNGFAYWANALRVPAEGAIAQDALRAGWESRSDATLFAAYDFGTVQAAHGNMLFGQMTYVNPRFSDAATCSVIPDSARQALHMFPQLRKLRIIRSWRSPAPFTPDHKPLVGRLAPYENMAIASGFNSAITMCPWAGELLAELAAGKPPPAAVREFDPLRFGADVAT